MRRPGLVIVGLCLMAAWVAAQQAGNVAAWHDPGNPQYKPQCLSCHQQILKDSSLDPRIAAFHQAMLPYTPGYSPRKGATNDNCVFCHRNKVDFDQKSGASLRRNVAVEACVYCHGRSGPGPVYYR